MFGSFMLSSSSSAVCCQDQGSNPHHATSACNCCCHSECSRTCPELQQYQLLLDTILQSYQQSRHVNCSNRPGTSTSSQQRPSVCSNSSGANVSRLRTSTNQSQQESTCPHGRILPAYLRPHHSNCRFMQTLRQLVTQTRRCSHPHHYGDCATRATSPSLDSGVLYSNQNQLSISNHDQQSHQSNIDALSQNEEISTENPPIDSISMLIIMHERRTNNHANQTDSAVSGSLVAETCSAADHLTVDVDRSLADSRPDCCTSNRHLPFVCPPHLKKSNIYSIIIFDEPAQLSWFIFED
ncbi:hypothetical protein Ciccas_008086 [Cichlidogyrus casuarinus]|uniref:Uncharacterized protein n=1 Tax=Cichlidogyrus casuarinus TaxID=1844966 RepID=A0ABD2Q1R5_9PLAT